MAKLIKHGYDQPAVHQHPPPHPLYFAFVIFIYLFFIWTIASNHFLLSQLNV